MVYYVYLSFIYLHTYINFLVMLLRRQYFLDLLLLRGDSKCLRLSGRQTEHWTYVLKKNSRLFLLYGAVFIDSRSPVIYTFASYTVHTHTQTQISYCTYANCWQLRRRRGHAPVRVCICLLGEYASGKMCAARGRVRSNGICTKCYDASERPYRKHTHKQKELLWSSDQREYIKPIYSLALAAAPFGRSRHTFASRFYYYYIQLLSTAYRISISTVTFSTQLIII